MTPGWLSESLARGQHVWTVAPHRSFVDAIADGLLAETGGDPLALAAATVLLPTRRAVRTVREAFLRLTSGTPTLLPRLVPIGDIDEDEILFDSFARTGLGEAPDLPPPIDPLRRQLLLTALIMRKAGPDGRTPSTDQAADLAAELGRFLDQMQSERLDPAGLKNLVPSEYAEHWQETLDFLAIVTEAWPTIVAEQGCLDPVEHRNRLFAAQIDAWSTAQPDALIIAAGSTGSIPATADLLATVATLPHGCVVLPGLDCTLEDNGWAAIDESHPQFAMRRLLTRLGIERTNVERWPGDNTDAATSARDRLISEAMRPAATTEAWRHLPAFGTDAVAGIERIDCATPRDEAEAIALVMRSALEEKGRTCALVTPDRDLAQRVSAAMERWGVEVDDSAGRPLDATPAGVFLRLTAAMVAHRFAPIQLLEALKHPLAAGGRDPATFRSLARGLEVAVLRGPRPPEDLAGVRAMLVAPRPYRDPPLPGLISWLDVLMGTTAQFAALMTEPAVPLKDLLAAHVEMAEALAASNDTAGPLRLWAGDDGEEVARFVNALNDAADVLPPLPPSQYPAVLDTLMASRVTRPRYGAHPRLAILGPLEARLHRPDVLILGGLNEGTWPADAAADPWMSRPMRKAFGLPQPERRIGLAAHDVAQALCAPSVIVTRAKKVAGTPTVASRWLMRLDEVIKAADLDLTISQKAWAQWAAMADKPAAITPARPPAPAPPVESRPRTLSVTEIETWMRDPYAIYARRILGLEALDPIDADPSLADYGTIVHRALQRFVERFPDRLPDDAETALRAIGDELFAQGDIPPGVLAFWAPRFGRIAAWAAAVERDRRHTIAASLVETKGETVLPGPAGDFALRAKADRIDRLKDGALTLIDYKTGSVPTAKEVAAGFAPQLPLEGVIATAGGFAGIAKGSRIGALEYWALHGRGEGGEIRQASKSAAEIVDAARTGLTDLIARFDDPATPYHAVPHSTYAPRFNDYQHLARVKEWAASGEDGGDGG